MAVQKQRRKRGVVLTSVGLNNRCRLVPLVGMGGIAKMALSVKLAKRIQDSFEFVIWRSLRNAPPLTEILANAIEFLSKGQETNLPENIGDRLSRLIDYFRSSLGYRNRSLHQNLGRKYSWFWNRVSCLLFGW